MSLKAAGFQKGVCGEGKTRGGREGVGVHPLCADTEAREREEERCARSHQDTLTCLHQPHSIFIIALSRV